MRPSEPAGNLTSRAALTDSVCGAAGLALAWMLHRQPRTSGGRWRLRLAVVS